MAWRCSRQRPAHLMGGQLGLGRFPRLAQQHMGRLSSDQLQSLTVDVNLQGVTRQHRHICPA